MITNGGKRRLLEEVKKLREQGLGLFEIRQRLIDQGVLSKEKQMATVSLNDLRDEERRTCWLMRLRILNKGGRQRDEIAGLMQKGYETAKLRYFCKLKKNHQLVLEVKHTSSVVRSFRATEFHVEGARINGGAKTQSVDVKPDEWTAVGSYKAEVTDQVQINAQVVLEQHPLISAAQVIEKAEGKPFEVTTTSAPKTEFVVTIDGKHDYPSHKDIPLGSRVYIQPDGSVGLDAQGSFELTGNLVSPLGHVTHVTKDPVDNLVKAIKGYQDDLIQGLMVPPHLIKLIEQEHAGVVHVLTGRCCHHCDGCSHPWRCGGEKGGYCMAPDEPPLCPHCERLEREEQREAEKRDRAAQREADRICAKGAPRAVKSDMPPEREVTNDEALHVMHALVCSTDQPNANGDVFPPPTSEGIFRRALEKPMFGTIVDSPVRVGVSEKGPEPGEICFNTERKRLEFWAGDEWQPLECPHRKQTLERNYQFDFKIVGISFQPGDVVYEKLSGRGPWVLIAKQAVTLSRIVSETDGSAREDSHLIEEVWTVRDRKGKAFAVPEAMLTVHQPSLWRRALRLPGKLLLNLFLLIFFLLSLPIRLFAKPLLRRWNDRRHRQRIAKRELKRQKKIEANRRRK